MDRPDEILYTPEPILRNPIRLLGRIFSENWARRGLCAQLFLRNIKAQYRQTFLGLFWVFLPAIVSAAVWIFLHSFRVVHFESELSQSQYLIHVVVGLFLWQSFVEAYSAPINAFQQNRQMMSKINFPREMIIWVSFCEVTFNACIRCLILIPFVLIYQQGVGMGPAMLLFPVVFLGLILVGITVGLFLVPMGALYLDIGKILTMITPVWMILTPIIYPTPDSFPTNLLVYCNLASPALITARDYLTGADPQYLVYCWTMLVACLPIFLFGLILYRISIPILLERSGS